MYPLQPNSETEGPIAFHWLPTNSYEENDRRRVQSMIQFMIRSAWRGIRLRDRPDVVIGSSPQLLAGISALIVARRFRVPFIFEVRDPWPSALVDLGAISGGSFTNRLLEFLERRLYREAKRIIAVMPHVDRRVAEVGEDPGKCVHVPNASAYPPLAEDIPLVLDEQLRNEARRGRTIVLYAGAHGVSNGLHDVLNALTSLRDSDPESYARVSLFFIGDGPEKASLKRQAQQHRHENVQFHDALPKPSMIGALQRADFVLVHFAKADFKRFGMSANKLFDAMAVGRPVLLATPLDDTPVDQVRCGIRYEPGSTGALADALRKAIQMAPAERNAMGQRGREEAAARYDLKVTGLQLENLLLEVIREHRR
jgi:glycosyltransferase involved in cell wall biosynthesis